MRAGIAAAELSHWVYGFSRSETFLISYLQDVGALYMIRHDPKHYRERYFDSQQAFPISKCLDEERHYKTSHCYIGSLITKRWHLGALLHRSILFHHHGDLAELANFDEKTSKMVALIRVANFLVFELFSDGFVTKELEESFEAACQFLDMTENMQRAAIAALEKWGNADMLPGASH